MIPDATGGTAAGPDPRYNRRFASWPNDRSGCRRTSIIASGCAARICWKSRLTGLSWWKCSPAQAHFDYHSPTAIADLQQWLAEAGLSLRRDSHATRARRRRRSNGRCSSRGGFRCRHSSCTSDGSRKESSGATSTPVRGSRRPAWREGRGRIGRQRAVATGFAELLRRRRPRGRRCRHLPRLRARPH